MPLFEYGKGPVRDILRTGGDFIRGAGLPEVGDLSGISQFAIDNAMGFANQYTGVRDQQNLRETWEREDTAVSRRVADMEAAGINPMAMFGGGSVSAAGASSAPSTQGSRSVTQDSMALAQFDKQLALMDAELNNRRLTGQKIEAERDYTNAQIRGLDQTFDLNEALNPERIRAAISENQHLDSRIFSQLLQNQLTARQITDADWRLVLRALEVQKEELGLTALELENLAKVLAMDIGKHNLAVAQRLGTPVGTYSWVKEVAELIFERAEEFGGLRADTVTVEDLEEKLKNAPAGYIQYLTGDLPDDAPAVFRAVSWLIGFVPAIAGVRAIRNAIKSAKEEKEEENLNNTQEWGNRMQDWWNNRRPQ